MEEHMDGNHPGAGGPPSGPPSARPDAAAPAPVRFFVTGTGRCGTMLLARALALAERTSCAHERSMKYAKLAPAYSRADLGRLYEEIDDVIAPESARALARGEHWGEVSGLLWPVLPELACRYGDARFVLVVRAPEAFAASAVARGFFDPAHPHALEHVRPLQGTAMAERWAEAEPVEKCLWYWAEVNGFVLRAFAALEPELRRVVRLENLSMELIERLFAFLGLGGFAARRAELAALLARRVNATPGAHGAHGAAPPDEVNPWSVPRTVGPMDAWPEQWLAAFDRWAAPLARYLYPDRYPEPAGERR